MQDLKRKEVTEMGERVTIEKEVSKKSKKRKRGKRRKWSGKKGDRDRKGGKERHKKRRKGEKEKRLVIMQSSEKNYANVRHSLTRLHPGDL